MLPQTDTRWRQLDESHVRMHEEKTCSSPTVDMSISGTSSSPDLLLVVASRLRCSLASYKVKSLVERRLVACILVNQTLDRIPRTDRAVSSSLRTIIVCAQKKHLPVLLMTGRADSLAHLR